MGAGKYRRCDAEPVMNKCGLYWKDSGKALNGHEGSRMVTNGTLGNYDGATK